jgi:hypothetical protein
MLFVDLQVVLDYDRTPSSDRVSASLPFVDVRATYLV